MLGVSVSPVQSCYLSLSWPFICAGSDCRSLDEDGEPAIGQQWICWRPLHWWLFQPSEGTVSGNLFNTCTCISMFGAGLASVYHLWLTGNVHEITVMLTVSNCLGLLPNIQIGRGWDGSVDARRAGEGVWPLCASCVAPVVFRYKRAQTAVTVKPQWHPTRGNWAPLSPWTTPASRIFRRKKTV